MEASLFYISLVGALFVAVAEELFVWSQLGTSGVHDACVKI